MATTYPPRRDEDDDERLAAAAWGERSEGFLTKYLPYAVGLTAAMSILWWGAVPQFRAAGLGTDSLDANARVGLVAAVSAREAGLGFDGVGVAADGDTITLTGTVATQADRDKAVAAAMAVPGVATVIDRLSIASASAAVAPSPAVAPSVEPSVAVPSIESSVAVPSVESSVAASVVAAPAAALVTASDAGVVLTGTVASQEIRDQLLAAAQKAYPGKVTDNLTVSGAAAGASVTYSGKVTPAAADALRGTLASLRGADIAVKDELSVGAGVADAANALVEIDPILFDTGKATLRPASVATLTKVAAVLKATPSISLEVQGHTDNQGSAAFNKKLSAQRANAVVAFLVKQGVAADRLSAKGYGSTKPVAPNDTEKNRQLNRRIAFVER